MKGCTKNVKYHNLTDHNFHKERKSAEKIFCITAGQNASTFNLYVKELRRFSTSGHWYKFLQAS